MTGAAGCRPASPSDAGITAEWESTPPAPVVGQNVTIEVQLADQSGGRVPGATVQVEAHMSHPGMAPLVTPAVETGGRYRAHLQLTMAGAWELVASVHLADGRTVRRPLGELQAHTGN